MQIANIFKINSEYKKQQELFAYALAVYTPTYRLSDNKTHVGIEVEVEGIRTTGSVLIEQEHGIALWSNIEDGSLRNNGREYVSLPVSGDMVEFSLATLHTELTRNPSCNRHEFSHRTSVHIHVDMSDMTTENIATLLITYLFVEPFLYNYAGGDRDVNIFTVPLNDCHGYIEDISKYLSNFNVPDYLFSLVRRWDKYTGMNLLPLLEKNTIEFRHMRGNIDVNRLLSWIDSLLQLKAFAKDNNYKDILNIISEVNTTSEYNGFVRRIFSKNPVLCDLFTKNIQEHLEKTSAFVKSCIYRKPSNFEFYPNDKFIKDGLLVGRRSINRSMPTLDTWIELRNTVEVRVPPATNVDIEETPNQEAQDANNHIPFIGDF